MARWTDLAEWRGPSPNKGGKMTQQRGAVVHIAEGYYEGTIAWQKNPDSNVSSHFIVARDGRIAQMVDTAETAWTQSAGNGKWLSIENEGFTPNSIHYINGWETLTPRQIEANARLFARGHKEYGYPLQLAYDPNGYGLGHHSMGCNWPAGAWGHCDCPGDPIIAQKQQILDHAKGSTMSFQEFDTYGTSPDGIKRSWGQYLRDLAAALVFGKKPVDPNGNPVGELPWVVGKLDAIHTAVESLVDSPVTISDEQLERVLRKMICGTPPSTT